LSFAREKIGHEKNTQHEGKSVSEAGEGMEVAISVPGITFDRHLKDVEFLYSMQMLSSSHFLELS